MREYKSRTGAQEDYAKVELWSPHIWWWRKESRRNQLSEEGAPKK